MSVNHQPFSEAEQAALAFLRHNGGAVLVSRIPDRTMRGILGEVVAGLAIYQRLDEKGLVVITEEEPIPEWDNFCFTPMVELTDVGRMALEPK